MKEIIKKKKLYSSATTILVALLFLLRSFYLFIYTLQLAFLFFSLSLFFISIIAKSRLQKAHFELLRLAYESSVSLFFFAAAALLFIDQDNCIAFRLHYDFSQTT